MPVIISKLLRSSAFAIAIAVASAASELTAAAPAVAVGRPAPALVARSFSGKLFDLSGLRGKVVVVNFWASWCEPCRSEMPLLDALQRDYGDRALVLGLSADDRHDRKEAAKAAQRVNYITGLLAEADTNGFGAPQALPLTYIIDPAGTLRAILRANQGPLSAEQLRAGVEAALGSISLPGATP